MAYRAASIANEFLSLSSQAGRKLTQIEIQKLVYFAHGWNLALQEEPLIGEQIEAWKYGPVVRTLYNAFREFGSDPITSKAVDWDFKQGKLVCLTPTIQSDDPGQDGIARALVGIVWNKYGSLAPFKLVEITHLPGSPWQVAYSENKTYISNDSIRDYFKGLMAAQAPQGRNG